MINAGEAGCLVWRDYVSYLKMCSVKMLENEKLKANVDGFFLL